MIRAMSIKIGEYREQVQKIWDSIKEARIKLNRSQLDKNSLWSALRHLENAEIEARELESTLSFEQEDWEKREKELMEKIEA